MKEKDKWITHLLPKFTKILDLIIGIFNTNKSVAKGRKNNWKLAAGRP